MGKKIAIRQEIKLNKPDFMLKKCNECNNYFPATEQYFYKDPKRKYGVGTWCKECRYKSALSHLIDEKKKRLTREYPTIFSPRPKSEEERKEKVIEMMDERIESWNRQFLESGFNRWYEQPGTNKIIEEFIEYEKLLKRKKRIEKKNQKEEKVTPFIVKDIEFNSIDSPLYRTFSFSKGIGEKLEQKMKENNIKNWGDVRACSNSSIIPKAGWINLKKSISNFDFAIKSKDMALLNHSIPSNHQWKLIPLFQDHCAFLDIETTGLSPKNSYITTIAVFDGKKIHNFIRNVNLNEFPKFISKFPAIVTFYGKSFDIPFIKAELGIEFPQIHFDVCFLLRKIGLSGGLKKIEKHFDISRDDMQDLSGYYAVILWKRYQKTKNKKYLETLLAYNNEDVINLEFLLIEAYNGLLKKSYPEFQQIKIQKKNIKNPYSAHKDVILEVTGSDGLDNNYKKILASEFINETLLSEKEQLFQDHKTEIGKLYKNNKKKRKGKSEDPYFKKDYLGLLDDVDYMIQERAYGFAVSRLLIVEKLCLRMVERYEKSKSKVDLKNHRIWLDRLILQNKKHKELREKYNIPDGFIIEGKPIKFIVSAKKKKK